MDARLAAVPVRVMDSTAAYTPCSTYRDRIRTVAVSGMQIRSTLFSHSQSGDNGFSDSGTSNSYISNNSGCSSGSALSAAAADFGTDELKTIARQMVRDGYTQRMVQALKFGDPDRAPENGFFEVHVAPPEPALDRALENWFLELDVDWVLQIRQEHGSQWQLPLQDNPASSLQELVERWIRGLTVTVYSILELLSMYHVISVTWYINASMFKMLSFIDAIVPAFKAEDLRTVLDMYICVRKAMEYSKDRLFVDLSLMPTLSVYADKLKMAISSTMEKVKTRIEEDDSWAFGILQGGGEVHRNTRWIADCIVSLGEAQFDSTFPSISNSRSISVVRDDMIGYLRDLLLRKSELCSDPSLRYLFLLNNSYFAAQMIEPYEPGHEWKLTVECKKYMCSYLDVSWGHVLSCIPKSHSPGLLKRWISTPSVAKFESALNKTYQVQKFWKVPDPRLRDFLRRMITVTVISRYSNYLKEHQEHVKFGNITPNVLEEMLGQLFEG